MTDPSTADAAPKMSYPCDVAVSGSTGLIGGALCEALRRDGCGVRRIVRSRSDEPGAVFWDQDAGTLDAPAMRGVDAVVHLAGESIVGRWTASKRKRITESRVDSTRLIAQTLATLEPRPRVLLCASASGIYGDRGDDTLTEDAGPGTAGDGFLREVCERWEAAADPAREAGIRVVHVRIGMVLAREGGALSTMLPAFKLGMGGRVGSGRQWVAWVHLTDLVGAIRHSLRHEHLSGPVNATAPTPVRNSEFTEALGRVLHRPTMIPVPATAARLAFGDLADELLLASQRVVPEQLLRSGYEFVHPGIEGALRDVLDRG